MDQPAFSRQRIVVELPDVAKRFAPAVALLALALTSPAGAAIPWTHVASVSVAATSTPVLAINTARVMLLLINDSNTDIYCNLSGGAAVVGEGVRLNASGGNFYETGPLTPSGAIACIHGSTGTKKLIPSWH